MDKVDVRGIRDQCAFMPLCPSDTEPPMPRTRPIAHLAFDAHTVVISGGSAVTISLTRLTTNAPSANNMKGDGHNPGAWVP